MPKKNFFYQNIVNYEIMWKNMVQPSDHNCHNTAHALYMLDN